jgi:hypothetical protein
MLYSAFIERLRAEAKDLAHPMHNDFTGDGATTLFVCTDSPILEGSYVIKVDGTQKTEGLANDYTIDRELGLITFAVAPASNKAVTIDYKYVHLTDASWLNIIDKTIDDMEGEFWREVIDPLFGDSVGTQIAYPAPTSCIDVINWWYKNSSSTELKWEMISDFSNWRYSKDENLLHLGVAFNSAYPMKIHYLKGYVRGATTAATLDIQSQYEGVLQLGCLWRYYDYRLADRVETTTKVAKERTVTPLQNIQALSQHYYKLYLKEKGRKKPTKPMRVLGARNQRGGTP